jgi:hypothetical protein
MGLFADLFYDATDPKNVAKAYGLVNERLKRAEGQAEEDAWAKTFAGLKDRGFPAEAALAPMETQVWDDKQKKLVDSGVVSPGTGEGSGYKPPDELTRWKQQIDALIQSGNPVLQREGMGMLNAYQQRVTSSEARSTPSAIQEYLFAVQQGYPHTFADWKQSLKDATTINMGGDANERIKETDLKNYVFPQGVTAPIGVTYRQAQQMGAKYQPSVGADQAGRLAMLNTATAAFPIIDAFVLQDNGQVNERVLDAAFYYGLDPTPGKLLGSRGLQMAGYKPQEIEQGKSVAQAFELGFQGITRTETGAAMPQEEIQNTKARFQPLPTDTPPVKRQRYLAYKYFIENATNLMNPAIQKNGSAEELTAEVNRVVTEALKKFKLEEADPLANVDFGD